MRRVPIGKEWWAETKDGRWLKWNLLSSSWVEQPGPPDPSLVADPPETEIGLPGNGFTGTQRRVVGVTMIAASSLIAMALLTLQNDLPWSAFGIVAGVVTAISLLMLVVSNRKLVNLPRFNPLFVVIPAVLIGGVAVGYLIREGSGFFGSLWGLGPLSPLLSIGAGLLVVIGVPALVFMCGWTPDFLVKQPPLDAGEPIRLRRTRRD